MLVFIRMDQEGLAAVVSLDVGLESSIGYIEDVIRTGSKSACATPAGCEAGYSTENDALRTSGSEGGEEDWTG